MSLLSKDNTQLNIEQDLFYLDSKIKSIFLTNLINQSNIISSPKVSIFMNRQKWNNNLRKKDIEFNLFN